MPLLFSPPQFFNQHLVHVLSWTLIHSLWQGVVLGALAALIIHSTKRTRAVVRYNLLSIALLLFVAGVGLTFFILTDSSLQSVATSGLNEQLILPARFTNNVLPAPEQAPFTSLLVTFFNANAGWIVFGWLLFMLLRSVELACGLYGVYRLRSCQVFCASDHWNNRVNVLCLQLGISRRVRLLQSGLAHTPAVVGFFKPVILFPLGMLAALSPGEVEAVLVHELAHIRRRDFLANMLQQLVEIVFFFNPAVRWVSSLIKQEREHCCDDIALSQVTDRRGYINALVAFQQRDFAGNNALATAFDGNAGHLLHRVKRIIYNHNKTLTNMEKKILAAGLIVTSVCLFAFSSAHHQQRGTIEQISPAPVSVADTIPARGDKTGRSLNGTVNTIVEGRKYRMEVKDDRVEELYIDGEQVPAGEVADHEAVTSKLLAQMKVDRDLSEKELESAKAELERTKLETAAARQEQAAAQKELKAAKEQLEASKKEMAEDMKRARVINKQPAKSTTQYKQDTELRETARLDQKEAALAQLQAETMKLANLNQLQQAKVELGEAKLNMQQDRLQLEQSKEALAGARKELQYSRKELQLATVELEASKKIQDNLVNDLVKEQIIENKRELVSFQLSDKELIVNDVRQSDELHRKFKSKYVKGDRWIMNYNHKKTEK